MKVWLSVRLTRPQKLCASGVEDIWEEEAGDRGSDEKSDGEEEEEKHTKNKGEKRGGAADRFAKFTQYFLEEIVNEPGKKGALRRPSCLPVPVNAFL